MSISTHTPTPVCRMNPTTIMTATHATPPTLESKIKRWVELDNKIKETAEEVRDVRTEKAVINDETTWEGHREYNRREVAVCRCKTYGAINAHLY